MYRNVNKTGDGGTTLLLAAEETNTYYEDSGGLTPAGPEPLPNGSLSLWDELTGTPLGTGREGAGAVVVAISGTAGTNQVIYVVGGRTDGTGGGSTYLASGEMALVHTDGTLTPFGDMGQDMNHPRAFFKLTTNHGQDAIIGPSGDPGEGSMDPPGGEAGDLVLIAVHGDDVYNGNGGPCFAQGMGKCPANTLATACHKGNPATQPESF